MLHVRYIFLLGHHLHFATHNYRGHILRIPIVPFASEYIYMSLVRAQRNYLGRQSYVPDVTGLVEETDIFGYNCWWMR